MTETQPTIFDRYQQQPQVVRWGILAALGIVVFLVWSDYIRPLNHDFKDRADRIAADVQMVRDTEALDQEIKQLEETIHGMGAVQRPRPEGDGKIALNRAVNEVLQQYSISDDSFSTRVSGSLQRGSLPGLTTETPAQLLTGELKFDASPDDAIAIIAALEMRPEVEAVNTVFLSRIGGRRVGVQITLEAWVLPLQRSRRGGSA